jgi:hypothetical protein
MSTDIAADHPDALCLYEKEQRDAWLAATRDLLEWYEQHPNFPAPVSDRRHLVYATSKAELLRLRRAAGFNEKTYSDRYVEFHRKFGAGVEIQLYTAKENTCKLVKVGERVVPAKAELTIPARPASVEDVYEWQCDEPLLADHADKAE